MLGGAHVATRREPAADCEPSNKLRKDKYARTISAAAAGGGGGSRIWRLEEIISLTSLSSGGLFCAFHFISSRLDEIPWPAEAEAGDE